MWRSVERSTCPADFRQERSGRPGSELSAAPIASHAFQPPSKATIQAPDSGRPRAIASVAADGFAALLAAQSAGPHTSVARPTAADLGLPRSGFRSRTILGRLLPVAL